MMGWFRSPYGAWLTIRLVWIACLIAIPVFAITYIFSDARGSWMLAVLAVCGFLVQGKSFWELRKSGGIRVGGDRVSFMLDKIGKLFSSQLCPQCGQSCFDATPPAGYAPETMKRGFWPNSFCANCGTDLTKQVTL